MRAPGPAVERELGGDRVQHLHKVWQEEDDLHLVVGQVAPTADALRPLDVGTAQQGHSGTLVHVLGREPAGRTPNQIVFLCLAGAHKDNYCHVDADTSCCDRDTLQGFRRVL